MSIREFVKVIKSFDPTAEFHTVKDSIVYQSKGWKIEYFDGNKKEIIPYVPNKEMSNVRTNTKKKSTSKR